MIMMRFFTGVMLSFGSIVAVGVMLLMAADVTRIAAHATVKTQKVTYLGR